MHRANTSKHPSAGGMSWHINIGMKMHIELLRKDASSYLPSDIAHLKSQLLGGLLCSHHPSQYGKGSLKNTHRDCYSVVEGTWMCLHEFKQYCLFSSCRIVPNSGVCVGQSRCLEIDDETLHTSS